MKTIKPLKLGILTRSYEYERTFYFGVSMMMFVPIGNEPSVLSEVSMWQFLPGELGEDAGVDAGIPKRNREFLVTGRAHPPGGTREKCLVRARVGDIEKTLYVFGDRNWERRRFTGPEEFAEMPLDWAHAFGGETYKKNPLGKGHKPVAVDGKKVQALPNVEYPNQLVTAPKHQPDPAGFGPVDQMWPLRAKKAGSYKKKWLKEDFPGFARDGDWTYFNIAPEDQQRPGPFRGDESYAFENMHPDIPIIEGRFPNLTARCMITRRGDPALEEIPTQLTTAWFFPHAERAVLIYQGQAVVREDDSSDVENLLLAAEHAGRPKGMDHYRKVLSQRLDRENGHLYVLRDVDLMPEDLDPTDPALQAEMDLIAPEEILLKRQRKRAVKETEDARAELVALGLDPDEHGPLPVPEDAARPTLEELPEFMADVERQLEESKKEKEAFRAEQNAALKERCEAQGMDYDLFIAETEAGHRGPPRHSAEGGIAELLQLKAYLQTQGVDTTAIDALFENPEIDQLNVDAEEKLYDAYRIGAHLQDPALPMPPEKAEYIRDYVKSAHAEKMNLSEYDLTGADLSGMDLRGVNFERALLESVRFDSADLTDANMKGAVLAHASLEGATLSRADFTDANLGSARLVGARAGGGTTFKDAMLMNADLTRADLTDADFAGANLMKAVLVGADVSGAQAREVILLEADLRGLRMDRGVFERCLFVNLDIRGVDFSGAWLDGSTFITCTGQGARFRGAHLRGVNFLEGCKLAGADFTDAGLEKVNFRATNLNGASLARARMDGADLSEADLTGARLYRASLKGALLIRTNLTDAIMVSTNLFGAVLANARLHGTDLRGSNLYGADLGRVDKDERTRMEGTLMHRTKAIPEREEAK